MSLVVTASALPINLDSQTAAPYPTIFSSWDIMSCFETLGDFWKFDTGEIVIRSRRLKRLRASDSVKRTVSIIRLSGLKPISDNHCLCLWTLQGAAHQTFLFHTTESATLHISREAWMCVLYRCTIVPHTVIPEVGVAKWNYGRQGSFFNVSKPKYFGCDFRGSNTHSRDRNWTDILVRLYCKNYNRLLGRNH